MIGGDPTLSYHQASAQGATPIGQVIALYDTILRDFVRALAAVQAGDVESRVSELNHALLVIAHLQNVLNFERGGEAAKHFERFYSVTRGMIVEANVRATPESLEKLIDLYGGLRQAWYQAQQQVPADQQPTPGIDRPGEASATTAAPPAQDDIETPQLQWSA
jgi:flagellar secretion chaperone FliS